MNESLLIGRTMSHSGEKGKISLFLWVSLNGDVSSNVEMRIFYFFYSQSKGRINSVHDAENKKKLKN